MTNDLSQFQRFAEEISRGRELTWDNWDDIEGYEYGHFDKGIQRRLRELVIDVNVFLSDDDIREKDKEYDELLRDRIAWHIDELKKMGVFT